MKTPNQNFTDFFFKLCYEYRDNLVKKWNLLLTRPITKKTKQLTSKGFKR